MIRLFLNPTAADHHAAATPPILRERETLLRVVAESWAGGYALRCDIVRDTERGPIRVIRYYHAED